MRWIYDFEYLNNCFWKTQNAEKEQQCENNKNELQNLNLQIQNKNSELKKLTDQIMQLNNELERLGDEYAKLENTLTNSETTAKSNLNKLNEKIEDVNF